MLSESAAGTWLNECIDIPELCISIPKDCIDVKEFFIEREGGLQRQNKST